MTVLEPGGHSGVPDPADMTGVGGHSGGTLGAERPGRQDLVRIEAVSRRFERRMGLVARTLSQLGAGGQDEVVKAVSEVSFGIPKGSVMGLVGESGCGKSTLARIVAGLLPPSDGRVIYGGKRIDTGGPGLPLREMLRVQMVFQNPMASLNPRQRVLDILTEAPLRHGLIRRGQALDFALGLLAEVGLPPEALHRFPHQFSGGQRQRIGIARALAVEPDFLICDEPVAALDVSIQAQILNLLMELRRRRGLTMLFISHDLGVVRHLCDSVGVMYLGRLVELAPAAELFARPRHPYAEALVAQIPGIRSGRRAYSAISGEIPSPLAPPPGCAFHPRCPKVVESCRSLLPPETQQGPHRVQCWLEAQA